MKKCPLLDKLGVYDEKPLVDEQFIIDVCVGCKIKKGCLYERKGGFSAEEIIEILDYWDKIKEKIK